MNLGPFTPQPPFVWPEPRVLESLRVYTEHSALVGLLRSGGSVFGVVTAVQEDGVHLLERSLAENADLKVTLIVSVYPTCATNEQDLLALKRLAEASDGRLRARVLPYEEVTHRPTSTLCVMTEGDPLLVVSGLEGLGFDRMEGGKLDFVFHASPALLEAFRRYFDWSWSHAAEIAEDAALQIPSLVLPEGSIDAWMQWQNYLKRCRHKAERRSEIARVDAESGEVVLVSHSGDPLPSPTTELDIPNLDPFQDEVARLYTKGRLVTIDKGSRLGPLDAPVDPQWFGQVPDRQHGAITHKVSMRISALEEKDLKKLERIRRGPAELLAKLSYRLADGVRWIPKSAIPLLEQELQSLSSESKEFVRSAIPGGTRAFLASRIVRLREDATSMYRALGNPGELPAESMDKIREELERRIERALGGQLLPTLSYTDVAFNGKVSDGVDPWGQARTLLLEIARFPRRVDSDPFFLRGLRTSKADVLKAMNVADDAILANGNSFLATAESDVLERIASASCGDLQKCKAIWKVIRGDASGADSMLVTL